MSDEITDSVNEEVEEIRYMPISEFRELGFIHEINRKLLHPCGLALEVRIDEDTGVAELGGVWDYRDDPEGMYFGADLLNTEKADTVETMIKNKSATRLSALGYVIQPVEVK